MEIKFANKEIENAFLTFLTEREFYESFEFYLENLDDNLEGQDLEKLPDVNIKKIFVDADGNIEQKTE
jgi:hypothetical protein